MTTGRATAGNAVERFVLAPAAADPVGTAVIDAPTGRTTTRAGLAEGVLRAAAALRGLGVQPEQRVLLVLADRPAFLHAFFGAMAIGAVPVPVSTMLTAKDYRFLLEDSRAVALLVSDLFTAEVLPAAAGQPFLGQVLVEGGGDDRFTAACTATTPLRAEDVFPATEDDAAFWLYTSGTTGFPKAAVHRHIDLGFLTDAYARGVLAMGPADRVYSVPKLFFAYGLGNAYFALGTGATLVLHDDRPTVAAAIDHVERHGVTLFFAVPTFLAQTLASDADPAAFVTVRQGITGGEPLPPEIGRRFLERFGVELLDGIGTTELGHIFISQRPGRVRPGATGWPVDGFDIELRADDGSLVPDGEPGNLWVAGESVTTGYWRRTDLNRRVFQGRFLATGDTFVRNDDGSFTYLGRNDDMIKAGGIWVSPSEVEACIVELEEVAVAAVVGATDGDGLTKPKAFVIPGPAGSALGPGELEARVQAHVKARLAPFKYPRWVEVRDELPMTATGKIKRYLLRD
ncbi:MAG: benzoate-CoA ligase family protein [Acidimicrobiia bacterium]|nr:benzoate-CoA ligase family protein [Acidimicrobiia bacterium]